MKKIIPASIIWIENDTPFSPLFNDVYFSKTSGIDETEYVFLKQNLLYERFKSCNKFNIAETGFGTGLNFISAVKLWKQQIINNAIKKTLNYYSFEKHPLKKDDIVKISKIFPDLTKFFSILIDYYPPLKEGIHIVNLKEINTQLTLIFGDANNYISELENRSIDAWFLDGFAPSKNESLWNEYLFNTIADKTTETGTFSTFTAAGKVRRGLTNAGFYVVKEKGFGNKREMLKGALKGNV